MRLTYCKSQTLGQAGIRPLACVTFEKTEISFLYGRTVSVFDRRIFMKAIKRLFISLVVIVAVLGVVVIGGYIYVGN